MIDECKNCELRGNLKECSDTKCSQHDSWIVKELKRQLDALIVAVYHAQP